MLREPAEPSRDAQSNGPRHSLAALLAREPQCAFRWLAPAACTRRFACGAKTPPPSASSDGLDRIGDVDAYFFTASQAREHRAHFAKPKHSVDLIVHDTVRGHRR